MGRRGSRCPTAAHCGGSGRTAVVPVEGAGGERRGPHCKCRQEVARSGRLRLGRGCRFGGGAASSQSRGPGSERRGPHCSCRQGVARCGRCTPRASAAGPGPNPGGSAGANVPAGWTSFGEAATPLRAAAGWGAGPDVAARVQRPMELTARPPLLRRAGRPAAHRGVDRIEGASLGAGRGRSDAVAAGDEVAAVRRGGGGGRHPRPEGTGVPRSAGAGGVPAGGPAAGSEAKGPPSAGSSRRSGRTRRGTWVSRPGPAWWPGANARWCRSRGRWRAAWAELFVWQEVARSGRLRLGGGAGSAVAGCRAGRRGSQAGRGARAARRVPMPGTHRRVTPPVAPVSRAPPPARAETIPEAPDPRVQRPRSGAPTARRHRLPTATRQPPVTRR